MHQATRKSPFKLFFGRPGFNIPGIIPEIDELRNPAIPEIYLTETDYNEWILNEIVAENPELIEPNQSILPMTDLSIQIGEIESADSNIQMFSIDEAFDNISL